MVHNLSKEFINNLILENNIIDTIGKYIKLSKQGNNYFALCPFHNEKTPSFIVSPNKNIFYCFGCNTSGNVINFIMKYKNINFLDSVKLLSKKNYTSINSNVSKFYNYSSFLEKISNIYSKNLFIKLKNANIVSNYVKSRNLTKSIIKKFKIGYSSGNIYKIFINSKTEKKIKEKLLFSGLIVKKNNYYYERFKNRLIFPIKNDAGNVIGFSGRSLTNKYKPKYINSSESFFFCKRKELYGLYELKILNVKYKQILIVEGFLDVISLHKVGINNVVATMGTSLTQDHIKKLLDISEEIIFCFDGDTAGEKASFRAAELLLSYLKKNLNIKFLILKDNLDPDSYITKYGKYNFLKCLEESLNFIEFFFYRYYRTIDSSNFKNKLSFSINISNFFDKIDNFFLKNTIKDHFLYLFKGIKNNLTINKTKNFNKKLNQLELVFWGCNILLKNPSLLKNFNSCYFYLKFIDSYEIKFFLNLINLLKINSNINIYKFKKNLSIKFSKCDKNIISFFESLGFANDQEKIHYIINYLLKNNSDEIIKKIILKAEHKKLSFLDTSILNKLIFKNIF